MISDVKHLFICLFVCLLWQNAYENPWPSCESGCWGFLLLCCRNSLYILDSNPESDMWHANIFLSSVVCMLPAWMVSLDGQEIFILKESVSVLPPVKQVFCSSPWMTVRCRPRSGNPANGGGTHRVHVRSPHSRAVPPGMSHLLIRVTCKHTCRHVLAVVRSQRSKAAHSREVCT